MWNYGSLNDEQEADYIKAKMKMVNNEMDKLVKLNVHVSLECIIF